VTTEDPSVCQAIALNGYQYISNPFKIGCIGLMMPSCRSPKCKAWSITIGANPIPVPMMYTTRLIRAGELLTVAWEDFFISKEKAKENRGSICWIPVERLQVQGGMQGCLFFGCKGVRPV
jgi:hypothetical protein